LRYSNANDINQTLEQLGIDDSPDPLTKEEKQARVAEEPPSPRKSHARHVLVLQQLGF
jgi:hypothetical protein